MSLCARACVHVLRVIHRCTSTKGTIVARGMRRRHGGAFIEQNSCFYWSANWHWLGKGRCKEAPRAKISSSIKSAGYVFPSLGRTCLCDASCRYIRCSFKSNCLWVFNLGTFWHFCVVVACLCNRLWCPQNPILDLPRVVGICAAPSTRDQSNES